MARLRFFPVKTETLELTRQRCSECEGPLSVGERVVVQKRGSVAPRAHKRCAKAWLGSLMHKLVDFVEDLKK
jgi:hypothetical protein